MSQTQIVNEAGAVLATVRASGPPSSIAIRRAGWRKLEDAAKSHQKHALAHVRDLGGLAVIKELQAAGGREAVERDAQQQEKADPLIGYDKGALLIAGIVACDGQPPSIEQLDDLELDVAEAVAREILRLSRPQLFETEADRKNG